MPRILINRFKSITSNKPSTSLKLNSRRKRAKTIPSMISLLTIPNWSRESMTGVSFSSKLQIWSRRVRWSGTPQFPKTGSTRATRSSWRPRVRTLSLTDKIINKVLILKQGSHLFKPDKTHTRALTPDLWTELSSRNLIKKTFTTLLSHKKSERSEDSKMGKQIFTIKTKWGKCSNKLQACKTSTWTIWIKLITLKTTVIETFLSDPMSWIRKVEEESPTPSPTSWKPRSKWVHLKITLISSTTKTQ